MKRIAMAAAFVLVAGVLALTVVAAPKPSEVPLSWELQFEHRALTPIRVQVPGESSPRLFWYMTYTVTNQTGEDQIFVPEMVMYTNTGQVLRSMQGVPTCVFDAVKRQLNNPLLKDQSSVSGRLLQGEDNAKDAVAIWQDFDPKAGIIDIFIGGLSGETQVVPLPEPITIEQTDIRGNKVKVQQDKIILSKTLQLNYQLPGEAAGRASTTPKLIETTWVMR